MCGPHNPLGGAPKTERQQLQAVIERLELLKKEWCPDALLVLDAAKKHLQTLPKPAKVRVTVTLKMHPFPFQQDFDSRSDAVAWVTVNLWAYDRICFDEVEGC